MISACEWHYVTKRSDKPHEWAIKINQSAHVGWLKRWRLEREVRRHVEDELANEAERIQARLERPRGGWPDVAAGDIFVVSGAAFRETRMMVDATKTKFAIVVRTPHPDEDHVEVVLCDSFKSDREDHVAALSSGGHVAIASVAEGGPLNQRGLVDCLKAWPLHRHHLGRKSKSTKKRRKGNVGPDVLSQIHDALDNVRRGGADLQSFHAAVRARRSRRDQ